MADHPQQRRVTPREARSSGPIWPSDSVPGPDPQQKTPAARDISQMHTQRLTGHPGLPEMMTPPKHTHATYTPLPEPILPVPATATPFARPAARPGVPDPNPRTVAIAAHLKDAIRLRREAEGLLASLQVTSTLAADASERWLSLLHLIGRTPEQNQAYRQLEEQVLEYSRRLANLRQQWSVRMAQAREHEEIARVMQDAALRKSGFNDTMMDARLAQRHVPPQ